MVDVTCVQSTRIRPHGSDPLMRDESNGYTSHLTSHTLYPTPYTLHPSPHALHTTPSTDLIERGGASRLSLSRGVRVTRQFETDGGQCRTERQRRVRARRHILFRLDWTKPCDSHCPLSPPLCPEGYRATPEGSHHLLLRCLNANSSNSSAVLGLLLASQD